MPEADTKKPQAPKAEAAPPPPRSGSWIMSGLGLTASLALLVATLWVVTQYLKHRPLDLRDPTHNVGTVAADVLRNQGLSKESFETSEPKLEQEPGAHYFRTNIEAHVPDTRDAERVMNALERAFWREQIVVASEDVGESERSAVLTLQGFDVGEIRLHHAEVHPKAQPAKTPEPVQPETPAELPPPEAGAIVPEPEPEPAKPSAAESAAITIAPAGQWAPAFGAAMAGGPTKVAQTLPRLAIIVDDGGYGGEATEIILGLDSALTLAILPNTPHATTLAGEAKQRGFEVMLHMPMENTSPTLVHPGQLDGGMDAAEIRRVTESALAQVPGAVGINNHEGSKFTANAKALGRFMEGIKDSGLFFIDSRTTPESVAFEVARQFGIPAASRSLFLDHDNDPAAIRVQFQKLIDEAKTQGHAIGICHFRQNTAEALRDTLPTLSAAGIQLVHASELVQ